MYSEYFLFGASLRLLMPTPVINGFVLRRPMSALLTATLEKSNTSLRQDLAPSSFLDVGSPQM
jgi:hypothetical protein